MLKLIWISHIHAVFARELSKQEVVWHCTTHCIIKMKWILPGQWPNVSMIHVSSKIINKLWLINLSICLIHQDLTLFSSLDNSVLEDTISQLMSSFKDETGLIVWQCQVCNLQMRKKYRMKRHVEGLHVSGFVHTCTICGSIHRTKAAVEAHTYQKHRGPQY